MKCAVRGSLEIQDAKITHKIAICAPSHKFVQLCLRNWTKACVDNRKKTC